MSENLVKALVLNGTPAQVVCMCGKSISIGTGTLIGNEIEDANKRGVGHYERFCEACGHLVLSIDFPRRPIAGELRGPKKLNISGTVTMNSDLSDKKVCPRCGSEMVKLLTYPQLWACSNQQCGHEEKVGEQK